MALLRTIARYVPMARRGHQQLLRWRAWRGFVRDFGKFAKFAEASDGRFPVRWEDRFPCLEDKTQRTPFEPHYTYHPAWAARVLAQTRPALHVDISSSLAFVTIVSAFLPVRFYDYRPANVRLKNLECDTADLTRLPFASDSIPSLSCLHVVEHIGLGRYGDPLDPGGDLQAMAELQRVVAPGGSLLIVVPVGKPKLQFNAHRIYAYRQIVGAFRQLELASFTLIPDGAVERGILCGASEADADQQNWGCGCFWFTKPPVD